MCLPLSFLFANLPFHTQTLFSCPAGRRLTVPVTLTTDSTVRSHSTAFKSLADLKQKEKNGQAQVKTQIFNHLSQKEQKATFLL